MVWTTLGIIGIALLAVLLSRRKKPQKAASSRPRAQRAKVVPHRRGGPYAAVSIKPGKNACARVRERGNVRYLESAAPTIPVLGCDSANCQCALMHHSDRRADMDHDRRMGIGLQSELYASGGKTERRQRRGRRMGDRSVSSRARNR